MSIAILLKFAFDKKSHLGYNKLKKRVLKVEKVKGKIKKPAMASIWYFISSGVVRGVSVIGTPIFTRLLTPSEYGLFPLYSTWLGIVTVIVSLEIGGSVMYRGLERYKEKSSDFVVSSLGLFSAVFFNFCILYFTFSGFLNSITGLSTFASSLLLIQVFLNTVVGLYTGFAKFRYKYRDVAIMNVLNALLSPIISISFILLSPYKSYAKIFGAHLSTLVIAVPVLIFLIKTGGRLFDREIWLYLIKRCVPLLPHYLSMALIARIGEIAVNRFHGREALGKYSVAMSLGLSLTVLSGAVLSALSPWVIRKIKAGEFPIIREVLFMGTKLISLAVLVVLCICPETLMLISPSEYQDVLPAVFPLALTILPIFLSNAIVSCEAYYERSARTSIPSVITAVICCVLSYLVVPRIDYRYSGLIILGSYILLLVLNSLAFRSLSGEAPLYARKTALISLFVLSYASLIFFLRSVFASRIILLLPLIPMLIYNLVIAYRRVKE